MPNQDTLETEVIELGKICSLDLTGDPEDVKGIVDADKALAIIKGCLKEARTERNLLRDMIEQNRNQRSILEWCKYVKLYRESKGFITTRENMLEKLMLVVTEVAEAAEDVRHARWEHFEEEIADTMIRLFDIAGSLEFDLEAAMRVKMETNLKRPYRHGKLA